MTNATPARQRTRDFGSIRRLKSRKWNARYSDKAGHRHSKTFETKADASAWLSAQETALAAGDSTDPRKGKETFGLWADRWLDVRAHRAPKTLEAEEAILRLHVLPVFGKTQIGNLRHDDVQRFVSRQTRAGVPSGTVRKRHRVIFAVLRYALKNSAVAKNVAVGVELPPVEHEERVFLTAPQIEALVEAITYPQRSPAASYPEHGLRVMIAAYTGMRAAEIAGLRAGNVNLLDRTVRVVETTVIASGVVHERQRTKTRNSTRTIKMPRFLADRMAEHLGSRAADRDALVFEGRHNTFYKSHFMPAVRQAGLDPAPTFHDMRHTCAALLIGRNAPILLVSRQLGHATITTTMNLYGHLLPSLLDDAADGLDATRTAALATPIQTASVHQIGGSAAG